MWDVFFDHQVPEGLASLDTIIDAVKRADVTTEMLVEYRAALEAKLGCTVDCVLIPYGTTEVEQAAMLGLIAAAIREGESIYLDVTHGFRHLPMLAMVAARYLTHVRRVKVKEIYYGALDMTDAQTGETPVVKLTGLLNMLDWVDALSTFDKDGDYGPFAGLLKKEGLDKGRAELLQRAAFFERISNTAKAKETLGNVKASIEGFDGPLSALFREPLLERISWYQQGSREVWERKLAKRYLDRGDYIRAATFMFESICTREVFEKKLGDPNSFECRSEAYKTFKDGNRDAQKLEAIRNSLAHGSRPRDNRDESDLASEEKLKKVLTDIFDRLLKPHP